MFVNIAVFGKEEDSSILIYFKIGNEVYERLFPLNEQRPALLREKGDVTFKLQKHLMKPYRKLSAVCDEKNYL